MKREQQIGATTEKTNIFKKAGSAVAGFFRRLGKGKSIALGSAALVLTAAIVLGVIFLPVWGGYDQGTPGSVVKVIKKKIIKVIKNESSAESSGDDSYVSSGSDGLIYTGTGSQPSGSTGNGSTLNGSTITGGEGSTYDKEDSKGAVIYYVEDFGAVGDGVTDDGPAIVKAVNAAAEDSSAKKAVRFGKDKTYRVASIPQSNQTYKALFQLFYAENLYIQGSSTKLLLKAPVRVAYIQECKNISMSGFIVDYDPKPFAVGKVTAVDTNESAITFNCSYDLGIPDGITQEMGEDYFAFRNRTDERRHYFIKSVKNNGGNSYTFYFKSTNNFNYAIPGEDFILPVYGAAHNGSQCVSIQQNENVTVKNITISSAPAFVFGLRGNSGNVDFYNIRLAPASDSKVLLTSWRDGFHIKDNTAKLVWNRCFVGPLGDDAFNLASVTWKVDAYNPTTKSVTALASEGGTARNDIAVGGEVVFYDPDKNVSIGTATITKIVSNSSAVSFMIDKDLNLPIGCLAAYYGYNKDFVIKNSYFTGTVRVRSSGIFSNCKFNVFWVNVENDSNAIEGPVPKDITFSSCTFSTPYPAGTSVFHVGTNTNYGTAGEFKCSNIVLSGCNFVKCSYDVQPGNELEIK